MWRFPLLFVCLAISASAGDGSELRGVDSKAVGVYVQRENGKLRVAWGPVFGECKITGDSGSPDCVIDYWAAGTRGRDGWQTGHKGERWRHVGPVHALKEETTEGGKKWTVHRVLYLSGRDIAAIHYAECNAIGYKGLTVWKGLSTEWGLVVDAAEKAGLLHLINDASLIGKVHEVLGRGEGAEASGWGRRAVEGSCD